MRLFENLCHRQLCAGVAAPGGGVTRHLGAERYEHLARTLEAARFDAAFFADGLGVSDLYRNSYADYLGRGGQISLLDPMTVLPLMARVTTHLGIGRRFPPRSTSPNHLARSLGSLDLISKGRVAWNVVTLVLELRGAEFRRQDDPAEGRALRPW